MTVNAGAIPASHWTQDPQVGGGRIIGEACHFIDLLRHLADSEIEHANIDRMQSPCGDTATISLRFKDGSIGAVHYFANGPKSLSKERLEVFASGRVLQLDNYRVLRGFGWPRFKAMRLWRQDKGQRACAAAFTAAIAGALGGGHASPMEAGHIFATSRLIAGV
jgi:predicted dehydrogenase